MKQRNLTVAILAPWAVMYLLMNVIALQEGYYTRTAPRAGCDEPRTRMGYIIPGFQFGCWLGEAP